MFSEKHRLRLYVDGQSFSLESFTPDTRVALRLEDTSFESDITLYTLPDVCLASPWELFSGQTLIASFGSFQTEVEPEALAQLAALADAVVDDRNEMFTHDHVGVPNNKRLRVTCGSPLLKSVCDQLAEELGAKTPPAEHNKMGYKKRDVLDLTQLHVDRFDGMRHGASRTRRRVYRNFVNIGERPRSVCFAPSDPVLVDMHVPDTYDPTYLDAYVEAMDRSIAILIHPVPPPEGDRLFTCRYLATHLLHCEYGVAPDAVLIINSDGED